MAARIGQPSMGAPERLGAEKAVPTVPEPHLRYGIVRLELLQAQDEHTHTDQPLHERLLRGSRLAKRNPRLASMKVGA